MHGNIPGTEPGRLPGAWIQVLNPAQFTWCRDIPGTEPGLVYLVQGNVPGTEPGRPGPLSTSFPNRAKGDALIAAPTLHTTDS